MNAQRPSHTLVPSENWDDDFEFHQSNDRCLNANQELKPRLSVTQSTLTEDWDNDLPPSTQATSKNVLGDRKNYPLKSQRPPLEDWSEPGPSAFSTRSADQAENWDDDFEDKLEYSPHKPARSLKNRHSYHTPPRTRQLAEPDNWDDDFDGEKADSPVAKRTRHGAYTESSDDEGEFGFMEKEEDKTITTRTRRTMLPGLTPPPVPAIPHSLLGSVTEPFPRSPTVSAFSIPTTSGRNSIGYTSTSRLALRPTLSGGSLAVLPPSPPIHRERRRLRKKSRPPQHVDNNVFELIEELHDLPVAQPPTTPERSSSPLPPDPISPSSPKAPLLSRIGSVKRWSVRKKRASTGPSEFISMTQQHSQDEEVTPRAPSNQSPASSKPGWFFRGPGGGPGSGSPPSRALAELRHEYSLDKLQLMPMTPPDSPKKLIKRKQSKDIGPLEPSPKPSLFSAVRRPSSMQVLTRPGSRQTSYGSSIGRSSSRAMNSTEESLESDKPAQEGSRGFMGSIRRISLVKSKKHKRNKSAALEIIPPQSDPPLPHQLSRLYPEDIRAPDDQLLPPIELHPPSPPRVGGVTTTQSTPISISAGIESLNVPDISPSSLPTRGTSSNRNSPAKTPGSPQSASLGRSVQVLTTSATVPRRNSLGDLKIPARISQAQISLKRDLGMVREFAASVERLKELQSIYYTLVAEVQAVIDNDPPSRATSPTIFILPRPRSSRARSNTNPGPFQDPKHVASIFHAIDGKYKISWECAELLIELGGGTPATTSPPSSSVSAPAIQSHIDSRKNRERAITLSGEESKPLMPVSTSAADSSWRASTGRHDLSQRQLVLLKDMLHRSDNLPTNESFIPEEAPVNRHWRWGDAMSSTVTLPSEASTHDFRRKKRSSSRLGMSGLRDLLRLLKRTQGDPPPPPMPASTSSLNTNSSHGSHNPSQHHFPHPQVVTTRRRSKTSTGPELMRTNREPSPSPLYPASFAHKASSPRRPSLASIFRLGQKSKATVSATNARIPSSGSGSSVPEEEDWDRIDRFVDLDAAAKVLGVDGTATIKGKKGPSHVPCLPDQRYLQARPVTPIRAANTSQTSFWGEASPRSIRPMRSTRLSNVEEHGDGESKSKSKNHNHMSLQSLTPSKNHKVDKAGRSGSVRSAPPPLDDRQLLPDFKLAMTPENIKPLLENAREVHFRLNECIKEVQVLLNSPSQSP